MDLIDHDARETGEDPRRVLVGGQQRKALGRGQQDMRRIGPLPALHGIRGVARAILYANGKTHLLDRQRQVAADVGRKRLERRYVERVKPLMPALAQLGQAGQKTGERLAAAGGRHQKQRRRLRAVEHLLLVRVDRPAPRREPVLKYRGKLGHSP